LFSWCDQVKLLSAKIGFTIHAQFFLGLNPRSLDRSSPLLLELDLVALLEHQRGVLPQQIRKRQFRLPVAVIDLLLKDCFWASLKLQAKLAKRLLWSTWEGDLQLRRIAREIRID
jgi:hypothetical protein